MIANLALPERDKRSETIAALDGLKTPMPTILIVDDDIHARLILGKHIERLGYTAIETPNAQEALSLLFGESAVPIDMVISDVWMPGMSGIELLKAVRDRDPELPIAMISARATLHSSLEAINSGAFAYITKPFRGDEIAQVIARGMQRIEEARAHKAIGQDFARLAQLERQLHNAQSPQERDMMGSLIVGLRHELGNIVSAIVLNLEVLKHSHDLPDTLRENLEDLQASANDLSALITRFRDYPQSETLNNDVDLREVVVSAIDVARSRQNASRIEIVFEGGDDPILVRGTAPELNRAVLNLLDNAVEAARRRVQVSLTAGYGRVLLSIADDGHGFSNEVLEQAFLPTFTTKLRDGFMRGLGLGLFITRMVISLHGGSIHLENRPEGGARALLELPAQAERATQGAA
ncbi:MAG: hybrid sensor histidine kinase/response regulator [Chloroflexi bacterium CFX4]|nr:hybrid sensor histidine kinase/response regulator [Chloroflexi bacterium CFX4]MDL1923153.1 hybrid sensor histidine kinase/response regulator [Chloroflexi bacterium CFX3]